MDIGSAISVAGASSAVSMLALRSPDLLKEIYGDLAKPGVSQVGSALGTILGLGNTVLLPLRLLNEKSRQFEQKNFGEISDRFSKIPSDEVISTSPEIGTPILEKLSYTTDSHIRKLYIELLAKASSSNNVNDVHPSFSNIISNISPD